MGMDIFQSCISITGPTLQSSERGHTFPDFDNMDGSKTRTPESNPSTLLGN